MGLEKKCIKCKLLKPLSEFHNSSRFVDGKRKECKSCRKVERKKTYHYNKVKLNYYVYQHSNPTTGEIFYVGSGCSNRAWDSHKRSTAWDDLVKEYGGFKVEIVESGLTKRESLDKEQSLQLKLNPKANFRYAGKGLRWGRLNGKARSVINCRGKVFETVTDASKEFSLTTSRISSCCSGKLKTAGKYPDGTRIKWKYYEQA